MATTRRRRRKRRKERRLIMTIFTFLIVIGAIIASITVFLKVAEIEVNGLTRYNAADIIATSGIKVGDNMFFINKFDVAEKILNEYPYLETIKIRRRLPDTFVFEVTERVPIAYFVADGKKWLIDDKTYILEMLSDDETPDLPQIVGGTAVVPVTGKEVVFSKTEQRNALKKVLPALKNSGVSEKVGRIDIQEFYDVEMVYDGRFLVSFGDTETFPRKLEMLKAVVDALSEYDRGKINVSEVKKASFLPNPGIDISYDGELTAEADKSEEMTVGDSTGDEQEVSDENGDTRTSAPAA